MFAFIYFDPQTGWHRSQSEGSVRELVAVWAQSFSDALPEILEVEVVDVDFLNLVGLPTHNPMEVEA